MCLGGTINNVSTLRPRELSSAVVIPITIHRCVTPVDATQSKPSQTDGPDNSCSDDKMSNRHTVTVFCSCISVGDEKEKVRFNGCRVSMCFSVAKMSQEESNTIIILSEYK